jgi:hypothetical protein
MRASTASIWFAVIGLALALGAGSCGKQAACKDGTLFLTITIGQAARSAASLHIVVTTEGAAPVSSTVTHDASRDQETVEVTFPAGYPQGKHVSIDVQAVSAGGAQLAAGSGAVVLGSGCGTLAIALGAPSDGGVDMGSSDSSGQGGTGGAGGTGGGGGSGGSGGTDGGTTVTLVEGVTGPGVIRSSAGSDCANNSCTQSFAVTSPPTMVTLTAVPGNGARFAGWSGDCSGMSTTCTLTMSADHRATAAFVQQHQVTVASTGTGTVTSTTSSPQPGQISCPTTCTIAVDDGTVVTLLEAPGSGSAFAGWTGACSGSARATSCTLTVTADQNVGSSFTAANAIATWKLNGGSGGTAAIDSSMPFPVTSTASNVTAGPLTAAAALTSVTFANAFVSNNWPAGAVDTTKYFQFTVTAASGHTISYDSVRFSLYNNFDGASTWQVRSSVDSFASVLSSGAFSAGISGGGATVLAPVSALGELSASVTFRVYTFNNTGTTSPLQRGMRGGNGGGTDLNVFGVVF